MTTTLDQKSSLAEAFTYVMASFISMPAELVAKDEISSCAADSEFLLATVTFRGCRHGTLALAVPRQMCPDIVLKALGMNANEAEAKTLAVDALKEVLNITCGRMLLLLLGEKADFEPSVPATYDLDAERWQALLNESDTLTFRASDYPVLLWLAMEDKA